MESNEKKTKQSEDLLTAQEMRRKSLETFGETSVRKHKANDNNDVTQKRSKKFDTSAYLVEKSKQDYEIRSRELELKEKELEMQKKNQETQHQLLQQQNLAILEMIRIMNKDK